MKLLARIILSWIPRTGLAAVVLIVGVACERNAPSAAPAAHSQHGTNADEGMSAEELDRAMAEPADTTNLEDVILPNGKRLGDHMKERGIPAPTAQPMAR